MDNKTIISKGAIIHFILMDGINNENIKTVEAYNYIEISSNDLLLIDNELYYTDNLKPVEEINENEFNVIIKSRNTLIVKDSFLYQSINENRRKENYYEQI